MDRLIMLFIVGFYAHVQAQETYKASQCFKSPGIPKVSFTCPQNSMIKITGAFHGIAMTDRALLEAQCTPSPGMDSTKCTWCEGDCKDDSMNLVYDWSTCMGNTSCVRTVMQSFMPECSGRDKFSEYLQVEYQCINKSSVIDICSNMDRQWLNRGGYLMSPNYPHHYPVNQDCMCTLSTDANAKFILSFYDLLLETKRGRCRADWLMLRQGEEKHRHCGAIMTGTKNITSRSNTLQLQFHSDANNNVTQTFQYFNRVLKGFWLSFSTTIPATVQISCRQMTSEDVSVQEIELDDSEEYDLVMKDADEDDDKTKQTAKDKGPMGEKESDGMGDNKINTKMPDNRENEVMDTEVGKENRHHLEGSERRTSGSARVFLTSLLLIQTILSTFIH